MTIEWSEDPKSGLTVNLTCTATHGMPPPYIRWIVNGRDMTSDSMLVNMSSSDSGKVSCIGAILNLTFVMPLILINVQSVNVSVLWVPYTVCKCAHVPFSTLSMDPFIIFYLVCKCSFFMDFL